MKKRLFLALIFTFGAVLTPLALASSPVNTLCPVSQEEINPNMTLEHEGQTLAFCCKKCMKEFQKNPAKYAAAVSGAEAGAETAQA